MEEENEEYALLVAQGRILAWRDGTVRRRVGRTFLRFRVRHRCRGYRLGKFQRSEFVILVHPSIKPCPSGKGKW